MARKPIGGGTPDNIVVAINNTGNYEIVVGSKRLSVETAYWGIKNTGYLMSAKIRHLGTTNEHEE